MTRRSRALLGLFLALVVPAVACGDDGDDEADADADEELTPIKIGVLPLADHAPLFYGIEQGFFADEGLDITTEAGAGGAALTAAVMEDELQFAAGSYIPLMLARQEDVGVQVVSHFVSGSDAPEGGTTALLVREDGGIQSVEDLAGKTFGVNALASLPEVAIRTLLADNGVDDSDIGFLEVDWPDLNDALLAGEVDAVLQAQPFVSFGESAGLVRLLDPMYEAVPSMPIGMVFGSERWLEENPDLADAFDRAFRRSLEAASDEDAMRETMEATTEIPPDTIDTLPLPNWDPEIDRDNVALLGELAVRYDILEEEPDLDELVWTAS